MTVEAARGPGFLRREGRLTIRLMADNLTATVPAVLFTGAACAHRDLAGPMSLTNVCESLALFACYAYVFDAANQAAGAQEDATNKPWRPIPAGLATPQGLMRRFWVAMVIYPLIGLLTDTLVWVLAWQVTVIGLNLTFHPRHYLWVKPIGMLVGTFVQLAAAWQLVAPIDSTGWRWIITLTVAFNLPLRFEDIRDLEGDRRLGRMTLPMIIGQWPVRIWFAAVMAALPVALHVLLYASSPGGHGLIAACDAVMIALCWTAAIRSLAIRGHRADRVTYLLYTFGYCAVAASGIAVL